MTLGELERWLTEYIVGVYHAKRHRGIGTLPLQRWTAGVFGDQRSIVSTSRHPNDGATYSEHLESVCMPVRDLVGSPPRRSR
jgi:hypothetical protein